MASIKDFTECIVQKLVNDGGMAEAEQFIGDGQITIQVAFGESGAHSGCTPDPVIYKVLF